MNIVALDLSRGFGPVSRSLEIAAVAAERCGACVERIRIMDCHIYACTGCNLCRTGNACKIHDDITQISALIERADGVIIGMDDSLSRGTRSKAARSLFNRLSTYFRPVQGAGGGTSARKRAVLMVASPFALTTGTFLSPAQGTISELRRLLSQTTIDPIGSLEIPPARERSRGPLRTDARERASSLGRILAGSC